MRSAAIEECVGWGKGAQGPTLKVGDTLETHLITRIGPDHHDLDQLMNRGESL